MGSLALHELNDAMTNPLTAAPPTLSVVVVSYNVRSRLQRCLRSIGCGAHEILVVDNASVDGSAEMVQANFPRVRLLRSARNLGFGQAINRAVLEARASTLCFLNPDTQLISTANLEHMRASVDELQAALVGFRLVDSEGSWQLSVGPEASLAADWLRGMLQRRLDAGDARLAHRLDRALGTRPRVVPWVSGAAMVVRRSAFERVGGFDPRFFLYFEDIDLCLRLRRYVGPVYYDPRITVRHEGGASAATSPGPAAKAYRESQLLFWAKHQGRWASRSVGWYLRGRRLHPTRL